MPANAGDVGLIPGSGRSPGKGNGYPLQSKYCISYSFVDYDGYSISSKGLLPTVVDLMVI